MANDYSSVLTWLETTYWSSIVVLACLSVPTLFKANWGRHRGVHTTAAAAWIIGAVAFVAAMTMRFVG